MKIKTGLHQFSTSQFGTLADWIATSAERDTLLVACSDHGTAPDNLSFAGESRLLIVQHLISSIPSLTESAEFKLSLAEEERVIDDYPVRYLIVCGHVDCGIIRRWVTEPPMSWSDTGGFETRFRRKTLALVNEHYPDVGEAERCRVAVFEHVLIQLENLLTHSAFAERVANGSLRLFGWVVNEHSRVLNYDPARGGYFST